MIDKLEVKEWLEYNSKLQIKKNNLRKLLKEKGILKKEGKNDYDKYKYFSEAQYKDLFTELFSECGLELTSSEVSYEMFEGSEKQNNGRNTKWEWKLSDIETGFYETSYTTGEGIDKGDKAGYKSDTGALKYYLANTFMVATGDDPETDSPDEKMNKKVARKATSAQVTMLAKYYKGENLNKLLESNKIKKLEDIEFEVAKNLIAQIMKKSQERKKENEETNENENNG